jgi:hypothetical protein
MALFPVASGAVRADDVPVSRAFSPRTVRYPERSVAPPRLEELPFFIFLFDRAAGG